MPIFWSLRSRAREQATTTSAMQTVARCVAATLLGVVACAVTPRPATAPAARTPDETGAELSALRLGLPDLRARADLPLEVREMLTLRMQRHGEEMSDLLLCVVMLEYETTARLAAKLAEEPKLGRPAAAERGTLNAILPPAFFVQQDALAESARALSRAARERDDQQLVISFSNLTKSCVGCHSVYRQADFDVLDHDEPSDEGPCDPGDSCGEEKEEDELREPGAAQTRR